MKLCYNFQPCFPSILDMDIFFYLASGEPLDCLPPNHLKSIVMYNTFEVIWRLRFVDTNILIFCIILVNVQQVAVRVRPQRADEGPRIVHVVSDKVTALPNISMHPSLQLLYDVLPNALTLYCDNRVYTFLRLMH